jgi:hypothetical protein
MWPLNLRQLILQWRNHFFHFFYKKESFLSRMQWRISCIIYKWTCKYQDIMHIFS